MTRSGIYEEILKCLRTTALGGSERGVPRDQPLGGLGLGFDSLAMVEFLSALEARFGIELPEASWTRREELTLDALADLVEKTGAPAEPQRARPPAAASASPPESPPQAAKRARRAGLLAGIVRRVYERQVRYFVLSFDLEKPLPRAEPALPLTVRQGTPADQQALVDLYDASQLAVKARAFEGRFLRGYVCLTAWLEGRLVGIDWITETAHPDSNTGVEYQMGEGTCCGVDLYEHPAHAGRGIGSTLLLASLGEARKRGHRRQVTVVNARNLKMLAASVHLIGFEIIGTIRTVRVFRKPVSVWEIDGRVGRGRRVLIGPGLRQAPRTRSAPAPP
jgi:GNAT superfamily N-acetyltransferase/acyl carrier protein